VKFFLDHWGDIRGSDAMRNVWQQIRLGRHPGFEEGASLCPIYDFLRDTSRSDLTAVWPYIATNLEFKPQVSESAGGDREELGRTV